MGQKWDELGIFFWLSCRLGLEKQLSLGGAARLNIVLDFQAARVCHRYLWWGWFLHRWVCIDEPYNVEWSKWVFNHFEKSSVSQKLCFLWTKLWYQLLVGSTTGGGFETLRRDKMNYFISTTRSLQITRSSQTHPFFFSGVSLLYFSHVIA